MLLSRMNLIFQHFSGVGTKIQVLMDRKMYFPDVTGLGSNGKLTKFPDANGNVVAC